MGFNPGLDHAGFQGGPTVAASKPRVHSDQTVGPEVDHISAHTDWSNPDLNLSFAIIMVAVYS